MNSIVSIITPCFNSEIYIKETIHSVLSQTYNNWEWIIVDDKSTDNSVKVIQQEIKADHRVKLVCLAKNVGAAEARNTGIEQANGRYLAFIDSDDLWMPEYLERALNFMLKENYEFIYSSYERRDENLNPSLNPFIVPEKLAYKDLLYHCPIFTSTVIYDTKRVGKIKYPLVDKREDHALYLNLLKEIPEAHGILDPSNVWYRIHENSYSRNKLEILLKQFQVYYNFLNLSLPKSIYYTAHWALNGMRKYEKLRFRNSR